MTDFWLWCSLFSKVNSRGYDDLGIKYMLPLFQITTKMLGPSLFVLALKILSTAYYKTLSMSHGRTSIVETLHPPPKQNKTLVTYQFYNCLTYFWNDSHYRFTNDCNGILIILLG